MYSPIFDHPLPVIVSEPMVIENLTADAVFDQYQDYRRQQLNYDQLMGIYERTHSEIEAEAVRLMVSGQDFEIRRAYGGEYVAYVEKRGKCWARVDVETLCRDSLFAAGKGDSEFAVFLSDLAEQCKEYEYNERAEEAYYMRRPSRW